MSETATRERLQRAMNPKTEHGCEVRMAGGVQRVPNLQAGVDLAYALAEAHANQVVTVHATRDPIPAFTCVSTELASSGRRVGRAR